jgi:hypothetical protein
MAFTPEFGTGFEMGHVDVIPSPLRQNAAIATTPVKTGTYSMRISGPSGGAQGWITFERSVPSEYLDLAVWVYPHAGDTANRIILTLDDAHTLSLRRYEDTKTWDFYVDNSLAESGTIETLTDAWQHIQLRAFIDGSGYFQTKIDGVPDIDFSGDTQPDTGTDVESVKIWNQGVSNYEYVMYIDDVVYGTGDWPGDIRFDALVPNGDSSVQWTPSTGSDNYALVDERPPSTADYVSAGSPGLEDLYDLADWSGTAKTPQFVMAWAYAKKDVAGDIQLQLFVDSNSSESSGSPLDLTTTDAYYSHLAATDPNGSIAWLDNAIDALKIGIRSV